MQGAAHAQILEPHYSNMTRTDIFSKQMSRSYFLLCQPIYVLTIYALVLFGADFEGFASLFAGLLAPSQKCLL